MGRSKKPPLEEHPDQRHMLSRKALISPELTGIGCALREIYATDGRDTATRIFGETIKRLGNL